jgi:hypothetical protein
MALALRSSPAVPAPAWPSCGHPGEMGKGRFQQRPTSIPQIAASSVLQLPVIARRPPPKLHLPLTSAVHPSPSAAHCRRLSPSSARHVVWLGLAGPRCGRRPRAVDMDAVGEVPGDWGGDRGFVGVMNSDQIPLF